MIGWICCLKRINTFQTFLYHKMASTRIIHEFVGMSSVEEDDVHTTVTPIEVSNIGNLLHVKYYSTEIVFRIYKDDDIVIHKNYNRFINLCSVVILKNNKEIFHFNEHEGVNHYRLSILMTKLRDTLGKFYQENEKDLS